MECLQNILENCIVVDGMIKLPEAQLDRSVYLSVKKILTPLGGKWVGGKTQAFVFEFDPTQLLTLVQNGNGKTLKKDIQFFPTPTELAKRMVRLADLKNTDLILEPSAGQGAIIEEILNVAPNTKVNFCEIEKINQEVLSKKFGDKVINLGENFLNYDGGKFDKIIANPPFAKNQDVDHIIHMLKFVKTGGCLVTLSSTSWINGATTKQKNFQLLMRELGSQIETIPAKTFAKSGTNVETLLIRVRV